LAFYFDSDRGFHPRLSADTATDVVRTGFLFHSVKTRNGMNCRRR
jgi:hypothetical protein